MAAALAKTIQLPEINDDALGGTLNLIRWGYIEANLVIICASLPCLRSLILSGFHNMTSSGQRSRSRSRSHMYELGVGAGAAFSGRAATAMTSVTAQDSSHHQHQHQHRKTDSRLRGMLSSRKSDDGASVDHILGSRNSLEVIEMSAGIQDMGTGSGGIRKQVEVTVVAHDHDHVHSQDDKGGV